MYVIIWAFVLVIVFTVIDTWNPTESFTDIYHSLKINSLPKKQAYLDYLQELSDEYKARMPMDSKVFRGTCNDNLNKKMQSDALKTVFTKRLEDGNATFKKDPCIGIASQLCEFTHPNLYLSESHMPPRWLIKSYQGTPLPKHVNLNCFQSNYNCCKQGTNRIKTDNL